MNARTTVLVCFLCWTSAILLLYLWLYHGLMILSLYKLLRYMVQIDDLFDRLSSNIEWVDGPISDQTQSSNYDLYFTVKGIMSYPYLGMTLADNVTWSDHFHKVLCKANSTLGFLWRNFCSYKSSLVHPQLEYASSVRDPYHEGEIHDIEMV